MLDSQPLIKADFEPFVDYVQSEFAGVHQEHYDVRLELKHEIVELRSELKTEINGVKIEAEDLRNNTKRGV